MIYECPQCGDVFQTDVPAPVCDNCGGPMRETVGDFDPETGALWHVWGGKMQRECLRDTVTDAHHAVTVLNGMRGGGNMARAVLRLCALAIEDSPLDPPAEAREPVEEVIQQMRFMAELGIPVKAENIGRWVAALEAQPQATPPTPAADGNGGESAR